MTWSAIQAHDAAVHPDVPFAFHIPLGEFIYRDRFDNKWNIREPLGREALIHHLVNCRWSEQTILTTLATRQYVSVYGHGAAPWHGPVFNERGKAYLNTWSPPRMRPAADPGPYARIQAVLDWLTERDPEGVRWIEHWMAAKVQNPLRLPKVAIILATQQGGGKNTLAYVMREMLGFENTDILKREALESRFNLNWTDKLFLLGDEVLHTDNTKDLTERLKILVDGNEIEQEGKGQNQRTVPNRIAWMFASNSDTTPLILEPSDRRYSVFINHNPLTAEYKELLYRSFEADRITPTAEFRQDIANFWHHLLHLQPDLDFIAKPYQNESRLMLIESSKSGHVQFFDHVREFGIEGVAAAAIEKSGDWSLRKEDGPKWNFGDKGVRKDVVYMAYVYFCHKHGMRGILGERKFASACRNTARWVERRPDVGGTRPMVWVIPRPEAAGDAVVT